MAILTINSGSSSLKLGLYTDDGSTALLIATADGIGGTGTLHLDRPDGTVAAQQNTEFRTTADAFDDALQHMRQTLPESPITAIGHRMVHGGPRLITHQRLTRRVLHTLQDHVHFAPLHIPPALDLVRHVEKACPGVPQFACFDTAFHQTMPPEAYTYPIPQQYRDAGVRRYGFHGLSYESIVHALGDSLPARTVVAHLGSGSSVCALLHGKSVDTSMGVSPSGGVVMSTRTGDLDPGVAPLLERTLAPDLQVLSPDDLETLVNRESGLKALAGEGDMRHLLQRAERNDADAVLAVAIFCRSVAMRIAAYTAVLGGIDLLVFTGGIGEHSAPIRRQICDLLSFLGIAMLPDAGTSDLLSSPESTTTVRLVPADENGMIALHVAAMQC